MPNDAITLKCIAVELNNILKNGRIEKIYQPEVDEITLSVKNNAKNHTLVLSASPSHPRAHISTQKKENSLNAPAFCMLLRKYLIGASIFSIELFNCDRIIKFIFDARNELCDKIQYFMYVELMGRYSNIILTKSDDTIIDAIRRIHLDQSTTRFILPNIKYSLQPQNRIPLDDSSAIKEFFDKNSDIGVDTLLANISGLSKDTATEIINCNNSFEKISDFWNINNSNQYLPCVSKTDGKITDFFFTPYKTKNVEYEFLPSVNACCDLFFSVYDSSERKKANTKEVVALYKRIVNKVNRRIEDYAKKVSESNNLESFKQLGDLILSNMSLIKTNCSVLDCYDYYNDKNISIPLDPTLTPSQNAQIYYKKYAKNKRAVEVSKQQLAILEEQKDYLASISASIENCSQKQEFDDILFELNSLGGLKKPQKNSTSSKKKINKPFHILVDNCDVYIGKNNLQNAEVTFNLGDGKDMWLHVKDYHGAHAIIKGNYNDDVINKVASLVAYYSDARQSDKVEVAYTLKKYVKKHPGGLLGMVVYTNYRTVLVAPTNSFNI